MMDDLPVYEEIVRLKRKRIPAAVATVIETKGSTPRKAGAKMVILQDGAITGTIGGGRSEVEVVAAARGVISEGEPKTLSFSLTKKHGGVCGGTLQVYLEPLVVPEHLIIVGDGHVGRAVCKLAEHSGFSVSMIRLANPEGVHDPRDVAVVPSDKLAESFEEIGIDDKTYIFIATIDHYNDFEAVKTALETPACYIAVIGSRKKRAAMERFFADKGSTDDQISRVFCPAGLEIGAETPAEIAVSIVAQMIQVRRNALAAHDSHSACGRTIEEDGQKQTVAAAR